MFNETYLTVEGIVESGFFFRCKCVFNTAYPVQSTSENYMAHNCVTDMLSFFFQKFEQFASGTTICQQSNVAGNRAIVNINCHDQN